MELYLNLNYDKLVQKIEKSLVEKNFSSDDILNIKKAIEFATKQHDGQLRKSGEPYIIHPLYTALYLIEWNMDLDTIIAGLFHDLLEDTNTNEDQISSMYNIDILKLVKSVTKVTNTSKEHAKDLTFDKDEINNKYIIDLIFSMANDPRAIIIKLADRLHNINTLEYLSEEKQKRIANETFTIFANIAGRLGMYQVKTILLDCSFKYLDKKAYEKTLKQFNQLLDANNQMWLDALNDVEELLKSYNFSYHISFRYKGIYSIYLKLKKNYAITDIHDIFAIRIVVHELIDCYKVLGYIHTNFKYIPQAFRDYISNPKLNLYQSIHTSIVKNKTILELQIRTHKMDDFANYGLAAHWKYKENITKISDASNYIEKYILPQVINNDIASEQSVQPYDIFIKNNQSIQITNPINTCLDVAYMFNEKTFNNLSDVKINGLKVPFDKIPNKKDVIEFVYADKSMIDNFWLNCALNEKTKNYISEVIANKTHANDISVSEFYKILESKLKDKWIGKQPTIKLITTYYNFPTVYKFISYLNDNNISISDHIDMFSKIKKKAKDAHEKFAHIYWSYLIYCNYLMPIENVKIKKVEFPTCCNKVPGKQILGILNYATLSVHDVNCVKYKTLFKNSKVLPLEWNFEKINNDHKFFPYHLEFTTGYTDMISNFISEQLIKFKLPYDKIEIKRNNDTCIINLSLLINDIEKVYSLIELFKSFNINLR